MKTKKSKTSHNVGLGNETRLVLSGNPAKDFPAWLKSAEKDYDLGLELIHKHTDNKLLLNFLRKNRETETAKTTLLTNIKIISQKWQKK